MTSRQHAALMAIHAYYREHGYSPTYGEVGAALGVSGSAARKHVEALRAASLVAHMGGPRALAILPAGYLALALPERIDVAGETFRRVMP